LKRQGKRVLHREDCPVSVSYRDNWRYDAGVSPRGSKIKDCKSERTKRSAKTPTKPEKYFGRREREKNSNVDIVVVRLEINLRKNHRKKKQTKGEGKKKKNGALPHRPHRTNLLKRRKTQNTV